RPYNALYAYNLLAVKINGWMWFVDQHAADERFRLEKYQIQFLGSTVAAVVGIHIKSSAVSIPIASCNETLDVAGPERALLIHRYFEIFKKFGWSFEITGHTLHLVTTPAILGTTLSSADLLDYLFQLE